MKVPNAELFPTDKDLDRFSVVDNKPGYKIIRDAKYKLNTFLCKKCDILSWNQKDVEHKYCGRCHEFKED